MKPHLLLLHGALGTARQLQPLAENLADLATVHTMDFAGHGGQPLVAEDFAMAHFAKQVKEFIAALNVGPVHVLGYSMGGYAALLAAQETPELFASITTLGTKFDWNPASAEAETRFLVPEKMAAKIPAFVERLAQFHAPTPWAKVVEATAVMLRQLGQTAPVSVTQLAATRLPIQVLVGDADQTAGPAASEEFARQLPNATFALLATTPHALEQVRTGELREYLQRVL
ncbi:alpha/beta fold hydrolase [Hymenobacter sp. ASUV-10]|uniref:Alpha/beta fold hydrolase n=1 Tax=Hymenobacter aranciens TaxID=3063996 RepID=A0ABT9BBV0_9BACT|nr:alpha/beta fold hydrolase [Hymenobacter sp. ASUV-10]MDO7875750.1 alpha/beta fold hydrolase [Hymenobacter sp. ASUV-10]